MINEKMHKRKEGEIIPELNTLAFKTMYGNPLNVEITTMLLSKLLKINYEEIEGKVEILPEYAKDSIIGERLAVKNVVVRVNTEDKYKLVLEVNIRDNLYKKTLEKNLYYLNGIFKKCLKQGGDYNRSGITYLINFNKFYMRGRKKIYDEYKIQNDEGDIYTNKLKVICINTEECLEAWYNKKYKEEKYKEIKDLILICASMGVKDIKEYREIIDEIRMNKKIKDMMKEVTYRMNEDDSMFKRYISFEEDNRSIKDELNLELKNMKDIIANLYQNGVELDLIAKSTDISLDRVKDIIKNIK